MRVGAKPPKPLTPPPAAAPPAWHIHLATDPAHGVQIAGVSGFADPLFFRRAPRGLEALQQRPLEKLLMDALEPEIQALGFECVELAFASEAGRRILRITLDSDHGVTLDECAAVSRALGPALDAIPEVPARYTLEVSSPGINRPLTKPEHFQRFVGERVKLRLREKLEGGLTVTGILRGLQDGVLEIETPVGPRRLPLEQVARARLHRDLDALLRRSGSTSAPPPDPDTGTGARRWKR